MVTLKASGQIGSIAGQPINAASITIQPIQAHLINNGASVSFHICNDQGAVIFNNFGQPVNLTEEQIAGWTTDDNFIIDLLLTKYGLTRVVEA